MFDITDEDVDHISALTLSIDPEADLSRMGQWGVLHLCCGARAIASRAWKNALLSDWRFPSAAEVLAAPLPFTGTSADCAVTLADYLKRWTADGAVQELAKSRIARQRSAGRSATEATEKLVPYLALSIYLNSCQTLDTEDFTPVRAWAEGNRGGWPVLFFAAGLLLGHEESMPFAHLESALLATAGESRSELRALLQGYGLKSQPAIARYRDIGSAGRRIVVNHWEVLTRDTLSLVTDVYRGAVHPKVRIADAIEVNDRILSSKQFSFALRGHFDFVVTDSTDRAVFAVEFDEPHHVNGRDADAMRRDQLKDAICERVDFPLLRIGSQALTHVAGRPILAWLVDRWFAHRALQILVRQSRAVNCELSSESMAAIWQHHHHLLGANPQRLSQWAVDPFSESASVVASALGSGLARERPDSPIYVDHPRKYVDCVRVIDVDAGEIHGHARVRAFRDFGGLPARELARRMATRALAEKLDALKAGMPVPRPARTADALLSRLRG